MRPLHEKNLRTFVIDVARWNLRGGLGFQLLRLLLLALIGLGLYAYSYQARYGLAVTGMNDIVSWGFYISNFTFFVGVAAAAVMLI
ncbi:MAG: polysulfide reductase, partial [Desulfofustis sp.]|nr:polysulfide reductase [Desulfofustis sp.]